MSKTIVYRNDLLAFLVELDEAFARPGSVYLVGETSQVLESWRSWTSQIELTRSVESGQQDAFDALALDIARRRKIRLIVESPADLIPLPAGYEDRAIRIRSEVLAGKHLTFYHFDPFSVAYRYIARGDEPDYHIVLMMLRKGWVNKEELDARLEALLPAFTSETIQQDPAEFRRKYKGLTQMWKAHRPLINHRFTEV